jgi:hypothetical protein
MYNGAVRTFHAESFGDDVYGVYLQTNDDPSIDERFRRMVETAVTKYLDHQLAGVGSRTRRDSLPS